MIIKQAWAQYIHDLQHRICLALEEVDGKAKFFEDEWKGLKAEVVKQELYLMEMFLKKEV